MIRMESINTPPTENAPFIGPELPPGQGGDDNTSVNCTGLDLSNHSGADHYDAPADVEDYGSS